MIGISNGNFKGIAEHRQCQRAEEDIGVRVVSMRPTNVIDFIKCYVNINVNFGGVTSTRWTC